MTDAVVAALREAFVACVQAGRCDLCGHALDGEAVWLAADVFCLDCAGVHGAVGPRAHAVWRPEAVRLFRDSENHDLTD